jgi:septum formation protein
MEILLASTSPRRKELLQMLRVPFEVIPPVFPEAIRSDQDPLDQTKALALGKARSVAFRFPDRLVLGSDTLIEVEREILGKPQAPDEARRMLRRLAGRTHLIHTAIALVRTSDGLEEVAVETVRVWMKELSEEELTRYLATGESLGKAGAYGIQGQGGTLIQRLEGDYTAAVGLPLRLVAELLQRHGVGVPLSVEDLYRRKAFPNWSRFSP